MVKAHDSAKYDVISIALRKMGVLENFIKKVEKMYVNFEVMLKDRREEIAIKYGCGAIHGDNLALNLFILAM